MIARVGAAALGSLRQLGDLVGMVEATFAESFERLARRRAPFRRDHLFYQCHRVGPGSLPMTFLLSVFVGLTMALLTGYQLQSFGMVALVPAVVSVSFTREMGPLFTGIVLASRVGAAYTAELGAMTAGGEVDAIEGMGIGARRFLVAPRMVAIFCLTPCLTVVSILSGILGAAFISDLMLHLSFGFFRDQVVTNLLLGDVVAGMFKSLVFGAIIGAVACHKGLAVQGGAVGVGTATTSSVVTAVSAVIVADALCNIGIVTFFP